MNRFVLLLSQINESYHRTNYYQLLYFQSFCFFFFYFLALLENTNSNGNFIVGRLLSYTCSVNRFFCSTLDSILFSISFYSLFFIVPLSFSSSFFFGPTKKCEWRTDSWTNGCNLRRMNEWEKESKGGALEDGWWTAYMTLSWPINQSLYIKMQSPA